MLLPQSAVNDLARDRSRRPFPCNSFARMRLMRSNACDTGRARAMVRMLAVGLLSASACASGQKASGQSNIGRPPVDSVVFALIVAAERAGIGNEHMIFDPRPLVSDPSLVSTEYAAGLLLAEIGVAAPIREAVDANAVRLATARRRVLDRLQIATADISAYSKCPGPLVFPDSTVIEERKQFCPRENLRVSALSPARRGGPSSPNDLRITESLADAWTVRRIKRVMGPNGAATFSADYVLGQASDGSWTIIRVVQLVSIE